MSVRNGIVLLLALSALSFFVACGGSGAHSSTPPPSGAFSNTNFNGAYTFSVSGVNGNGVFAMAGTLVACGCSGGNISSGMVDFDDPTGFAPLSTIGSNSTYTISTDGRGFAKLFITTTASVAFEVDIDFVLTSSSHGSIIRYDSNGTGTGTIDLQSAAALSTTSAYAFSISGSDVANVPLAFVGAFSLDSSGNILTTGSNAGVADINYGGNTVGNTQMALSGSVSVGSGTTPGSAVLDTAFGNLSFDVYAIESGHLKLVENDGLAILVGDVFTQTSSTFPSGNLVFTVEGLDSTSNLFVGGGVMSSDGSSLISTGSEDINDAGLLDNGTNPATPFAFSGNFAGTGGGRFALTLTNFVGGSNFVAYPSDGGLFLLEIDTGLGAGVASGVAMVQNPTASLAANQGYGMSLSGEDVLNGIELDEIAEFKTTSNTFTQGLLDENDGGPENPQNFSGSYTLGTGGFGSATLNSGLAGMFFYAVDGSTLMFISTDSGQAALGTLTLQITPGAAQADVKARSLPMLRAMPHPHTALLRGENHLKLKSK